MASTQCALRYTSLHAVRACSSEIPSHRSARCAGISLLHPVHVNVMSTSLHGFPGVGIIPTYLTPEYSFPPHSGQQNDDPRFPISLTNVHDAEHLLSTRKYGTGSASPCGEPCVPERASHESGWLTRMGIVAGRSRDEMLPIRHKIVCQRLFSGATSGSRVSKS
jgi:hypothetical protein